MSADRLRAGIKGSGGGGQAKIAMSPQRRDLRERCLRGLTGGYKQSRRRAAWQLVLLMSGGSDNKKTCISVTAVFCQDYESSALRCVRNGAAFNETQSHMQPVVLDLAR